VLTNEWDNVLVAQVVDDADLSEEVLVTLFLNFTRELLDGDLYHIAGPCGSRSTISSRDRELASVDGAKATFPQLHTPMEVGGGLSDVGEIDVSGHPWQALHGLGELL